MATFESAQVTVAYRSRCEDRVAVINDGARTIIVVADGAGGGGDGDVAAETVIREIGADHAQLENAEGWVAALRQIDCRISAGESTAVVVDIRPDGICGASVGDSQAWIMDGGSIADLTHAQIRKPLLGSHNARPIGFSHGPLIGVLLVATDGFCNYVKRPELPAVISQADFYSIPRKCVEMVRLPSGDLWDDIGIVVCRSKPQHRTRQRYAL